MTVGHRSGGGDRRGDCRRQKGVDHLIGINKVLPQKNRQRFCMGLVPHDGQTMPMLTGLTCWVEVRIDRGEDHWVCAIPGGRNAFRDE